MVDNIKKKRLKTGLDILLGTENREVSKEKSKENKVDLAINISDIKANLNQPRSYFDNKSTQILQP